MVGIDTVDVLVEQGADPAAVQAAVAAAVPTAEVVDHATVLAETTADFTNEIDVVGNILLGFGGVALFVSIFIIYNTFAIVLGQRTRELALLRTVGADPRQIRRSVLGEAFVIGVLASGGGILGGIGVAKGLEALFGATGVDLPEYPLILANRTLIAAVIIGIGVTMLAAIGPARKASTVPAIAALNGSTEAGAVGSRTRKVSGFGLFGTGMLTGALGLTGAGSTAATVALLATGAVSIFLGVTLLSALVVGAITSVLGWPMHKAAGVAGAMAQKNAARNPRRTAATAAALMIGLALVSTALVVGQSIKTSRGSTIEESPKAEYYVTDQLEEVDFPASLAGEIGKAAPVDAVTGFRYVEARIEGSVEDVVAVDLTAMATLLDIDVREGGYPTTAADRVLISDEEATSSGLEVGEVIATEFGNGSSLEATIVGIFHDQAVVSEDYLFDSESFESAGIDQGDQWLAISVKDGADPAAVDSLVSTLLERFPHADVETAAEFRQRIAGLVDDTLTMVNVMVALAVIIALIGIANTLALSVFERTRELGLIRAVGMTRRQLRRMVRFEAALVATFGAVLGVGVGLLFGWGVVMALPESIATSLSIPVGSIATVMVVAAVAGVLAAWLPARRAGRLNVLDAIAH